MTICLIIPFGFLAKLYSGPAYTWVNNSLGGVIYVIFWSLLFFLFVPNFHPIKITSLVFIGTCLLECLQLWHPGFLESIRSHFLGRALIGTSFTWLDFFHYFVGFVLSAILLKYLRRVETGSA